MAFVSRISADVGACLAISASLVAVAVLLMPAAAAEAPSIGQQIQTQSSAGTTLVGQLLTAIDTSSDTDHAIVQRLLGLSSVADKNTASGKGQLRSENIMVAEADPYFERWQKDADERLKQERTGPTIEPHPLASANPGKSVVVCEAGCRTSKQEIVYIALAYPAEATAAKFTPSSSQVPLDAANGASSVSGTTVEPLEQGTVPCIAGCYGNAVTSKVTAQKSASAVEGPPTLYVSQMIPRRPRLQLKVRSQFSVNGAIVGPIRAPRLKQARHPFGRTIAAKVRAAKFVPLEHWRTKVLPAVASAKHHERTAKLITSAKTMPQRHVKLSRVAAK